MKNLYVLTGAFFLFGTVFGQTKSADRVFPTSKTLAPLVTGANSQANLLKPSLSGQKVPAFFQEDFESVTPPALPAGWTASGNTPSDLFKTGTNTTAASQYFAVPAHTKFVFTNDDVGGAAGNKGNELLVFPALNFSGKTNMSLRFASYMEADATPTYLDSAYVQVSTNGGTTWTSIYAIPKVASWSTYTVALSAYDNMPDVRLRIYYTDLGNWGYGIAIDDIVVDAPPSTDLAMLTSIYFHDAWQSPRYAKIPKKQTGDWTFAGYVTNNGTGVVSNAKINANVVKGTSVFNNNSPTQSINPGDTLLFTVTQTYAAVDTGSYSFTFTASSDSTDGFPSDNTQSATTTVTDTIFSRDDDTPVYQLWPALFTGLAPITTSYEFGNYYETVNQDTASSVSFEIGPSSDVGTTVQGNIYDSSGTLVAQTDFYTISSTDIGTFPAFKTVTLPLQAPALPLTPDNFYIVTIADLSATDSATAILSGSENSAGMTPGVMMVDGITNLYNISYYPFVRLNTKAAFNSCSATLTSTVSNVSCFSGNNGSINLSINGGFSPFTYAWSNGSASEDPSGLTAGSYSVTVTFGSCTVNGGPYTVSQPTAALTASTSATGACQGSTNGTATASPSGGTSPYSYLWSNGQTGQTANNLAAGSYTVTVTDSKSCTTTGTATVVAVTIAATASVTNTSCGNNNGAATANATGGSSPYSYLWSNAQNTATISGLASGAYTVTITDSQGCTGTANANIGASTPVTVTTSSVNAACGANDGSASVVSPTGTSYSYLWSNGQTTASASGLGAGTYAVSVTDNVGGCSGTGIVSVNNIGAATLSASKTDVLCNGAATGSVDISVTGGTAPFTYLWSNGTTTEDATGLAAGMYAVTVTGSDGCKASTSSIISEPTAIVASVIATDATCNGSADGSVNMLVSGGTTPLTYLWSNGATTEDLASVAANTYNVTITDGNGCTKLKSAVVNQPTAVSATATVSGSNINLAVSGGSAPYSFLWSNGATTEDLSGLAPGTYTVTVTDANGCTGTASGNVTVGIAEIASNASFTVFPNPNKGNFNVQFSNMNGQYSLVMRNVIGQVVYAERVNGNTLKQITINNLEQGVYFLTISGKDMNKTRKVVIE